MRQVAMWHVQMRRDAHKEFMGNTEVKNEITWKTQQ
jgi:hypothetical protein